MINQSFEGPLVENFLTIGNNLLWIMTIEKYTIWALLPWKNTLFWLFCHGKILYFGEFNIPLKNTLFGLFCHGKIRYFGSFAMEKYSILADSIYHWKIRYLDYFSMEKYVNPWTAQDFWGEEDLAYFFMIFISVQFSNRYSTPYWTKFWTQRI